MPLAKIHLVEGRYDETRIAKVSSAIQAALMNTLRAPPEDSGRDGGNPHRAGVKSFVELTVAQATGKRPSPMSPLGH
jgi:hypothetical protein